MSSTFTPRRPLSNQSKLPESDEEAKAPDMVPVARTNKPFTRWQRR